MDFALYEEVSKIMKKAKEDPQFFHELIFDTEKAIAKLDVDRRIKGRLLSISPENALAAIIAGVGIGGEMREGPGVLRMGCPHTCGVSCRWTCSAHGTCVRYTCNITRPYFEAEYQMIDPIL
jgi:hypothetical protein